jgi:hypothetical protein
MSMELSLGVAVTAGGISLGDPAPVPTNVFLLLEDGASFLLLEDSTDKLILG